VTGSLGGYAGGDQARLLQLTRLDWRSRAVAELSRQHGRLVDVFDDALLIQIIDGRVDEGRVAAGMARPVGPSCRSSMRRRRWWGWCGWCGRRLRVSPWKQLGVETSERRQSDSLDFYDLAVWSVREALSEAFIAGRQAAT
jgi:hypothetical protein